MKNKILALVLIGFFGVYFAPSLLAGSQGETHRTYPSEFKQSAASDIEIVKKASLPGRGKPVESGKPSKSSAAAATGILGQTVTGNKYAIVIGVSDYPGDINDLNYTDNDALAMRNVLVSQYGFADENIYLFTDGETAVENPLIVDGSPIAQNIYNAVMDLKYGRGLMSNDEVVFFFSGHGAKGRANDGDAEKIDESIISHDGTNFVYIWDGDLKNWFGEFPTQRIIFIFDSCVSGGMTDLASAGRIVNMATQETGFDTAVESIYGGVGAGEFTYYFVIKGMGEKQADITGTPGDITIEEAFDYTKANIGYDHPTISDKFTNDLLL